MIVAPKTRNPWAWARTMICWYAAITRPTSAACWAAGTSPSRARPPRSFTPSKTITQRTPVGSKHVAIEACQHIRPESVGQQMIAADSLIGYADVARCRRALQPACEHIRPAIVSIRRCAVAVGDGIAERNHCPRTLRSLHVNFRDLVPVIHMLGLRRVAALTRSPCT